MAFISKNEMVFDRQLKVQRLSIPFVIVGNASSASVAPSSDEPSVMFMKTQGVDQITPALASGESASFSNSPSDASGQFNIAIDVKENVAKVCCARIKRRDASFAGSTEQVCSLEGISQKSGANCTKLLLSCDSDIDLSGANTLDACLEVEYIVAE